MPSATAVTTITITAPATDAGVTAIAAEANAVAARWFDRSNSETKGTADAAVEDHDAVKLYRRLRPNSRSREALELLPAEADGGETPEELAARMRPDRNGDPVSKGSARAAIRVLQRVSKTLAEKGELSDRLVVRINFDDYHVERAGRYSVTREARNALDEFLAAE
jgi:hypothetical protein